MCDIEKLQGNCHSQLAPLIPGGTAQGSNGFCLSVGGEQIQRQRNQKGRGGGDYHLVSLNVRSESDPESFTRPQHLSAIPFDHGPVQDRGWSRNIFQVLAYKGLTERCVRWQRKEGFGIESHFWFFLVQWVYDPSDRRASRMANKLKFCRTLRVTSSSHAILK